MNVIKRDGSVVDFDRNKITIAIKKALEACDMSSDTIALSVTEDVVQAIGDVPEIDQESVLDLVQEALMKRGLLKVATAFIRYRERHAMARSSNIELYNGILDKLSAKHVQNQNANVDENSFGGRIGEATILVLKDVALNFKMSDKTRNDHLQNIVYQHDMEHWATGEHNCLQLPLPKLLADGVVLRQGDLRSPNYISSALQQLVVYLQSQSTQMFGGCAAVIDFAMVPYVRKSFKAHYLKRVFEDYMFDRDLTEEQPSEELKALLWKYPTKASWYALDDDALEGIENAFVVWYMGLTGLTDDDFKFASTKLDATRKVCAIQDTRKEAHQAMEGLFHNLVSILARSGSQLPFSSTDAGLCTEPEGRLITEQMLLCCLDGIGKLHTTAIFPITIFVCKKGVNLYPEDPNYDLFQLALKCTAKRLYPMFLNGDWSNQQAWLASDREAKRRVIGELTEEQRAALIARLTEKPEVANKLMLKVVDGGLEVDNVERDYESMTCMGCRTVNGFDLNAEDSYRKAIADVIQKGDTDVDVLSGAQKYGRGNIAPVTIILPELAMLANRDVEAFMQLLEIKIQDAAESLIERFEIIKSQPPSAAPFMYTNRTMVGYIPEEGIESALKHGTFAIGQLGLAEALQLLIGTDQTTPEGMELAKRIEQLYKDKINELRSKYKMNFGVYASPSEMLCYTALKKFREHYGVIPNVSDKEFFTNSFHVPVWRKMNAFEKVDLEAQLTGYTTAGCVTWVELDGNVKNNLEGLEELIRYAMEHDIPYIGANLPNDQCQSCGYLGDIPDRCPKCGSTDVRRLRRITGYCSTDYRHFNLGKQDEVHHRIKHIG